MSKQWQAHAEHVLDAIQKLQCIQQRGRPDYCTSAKIMSELNRITVDPQVCGGRPCIRGLRIRVKDILSLLAAGAETNDILKDYPYLEAEDITAALEYAATQSDHPVLSVA